MSGKIHLSIQKYFLLRKIERKKIKLIFENKMFVADAEIWLKIPILKGDLVHYYHILKIPF